MRVFLLAFSFLLLLSGCGPQLMPFPMDSYVQDADSLAGNRYALRAAIDSQLEWDPDKGRLLVVDSDGRRVVVFVPADIDESIHVGQHFEFAVLVHQNGLLEVEALQKY